MNIEDVLKSGGNAQEFWGKLAERVTEMAHFKSTLFLLMGQDGVPKLLGKSGSADLKAIPNSLKEGISKGLFNRKGVHQKEGKDCHWSILSMGNSLGQVILNLNESSSQKTEEELTFLQGSIESLIYAYTAQREVEEKHYLHEEIVKVVDIGLLMGEASHFEEAAMRLCNAIADQHKAARVTLGWNKGNVIKLIATNHGGKLRNDTEMAGKISQLMEEAMEQNCEIASPALEESSISQQHHAFSQANGNCRVISLPLRVDGNVCGVLTLEHGGDEEPLAADKVDGLRSVLDLTSSHLNKQYQESGWLGARVWKWIRRKVGGVVGYRNTGWKLAGLILLLAFILSWIIPIKHKVKAPFLLKTQASAAVTAPFSGYLESVHASVGEKVNKGDLLVELDKKELAMKATETRADRNRSLADARRYQAEGKLAEMRLAQLDVQKAESQLNVLDFQLDRTSVSAPFQGIIVEGDLHERLSSPVKAGEPLMRLVQLVDTYAELRVDERDIHFLEAEEEGNIAFTSNPETRYLVSLDKLEPVALVEEKGTVFRVRVNIKDAPEDWWRPGMSGICKIDQGYRPIAWVFLHRTWEYIRLRLWF